MIGIIRYCKGYVRIRVWGYSPERFMNLCTNRGILLWGVRSCDGYYTMYVSLSGFFCLKRDCPQDENKGGRFGEKRAAFFGTGCKAAQDVCAGHVFVPAFYPLYVPVRVGDRVKGQPDDHRRRAVRVSGRGGRFFTAAKKARWSPGRWKRRCGRASTRSHGRLWGLRARR